MLKVKSFSFDQDKEMNELLTQYPLAENSSVFVSDGKIIIPYDDGTPMNAAQRIIRMQEECNKNDAKCSVLYHSRRVTEKLIELATAELNTLNADIEAAQKAKQKQHVIGPMVDARKALEGNISAFRSTVKRTGHEIHALTINNEAYQEQIAKLKA